MLITFKVGLRMSFWLLCLIVPGGCGKGFEKESTTMEDITSGEYHAVLQPLNRSFGSYQGWLSLSISENQIWTRVKISGKKTKDMHGQYIHVASRCPIIADDSNGDGIVDSMEVIAVSGPMLLPLDGNLTSQQKGLFEFPKMQRQSFYFYSEAANFRWMLEDLRRPDTIRDDYLTKLQPRSRLDLDRRVLIIYGVDEERYLPSTVRALPGFSQHRSFPIACGEIAPGRSDVFHE